MYGIIIIYKLSMHPSSRKGEKMNDWRQVYLCINNIHKWHKLWPYVYVIHQLIKKKLKSESEICKSVSINYLFLYNLIHFMGWCEMYVLNDISYL